MSESMSSESSPEKPNQDPEQLTTIAGNNPKADNNVVDVPDGGFGWFVVAAYFLYNFSQWGANAGYAVYLAEYLSTNEFSNASALDYAAIGGLAFGTGLFFGPLIAWLVHRTNAQVVIAVGLVLQCASLLLAAFSKRLWELYMTQGVMISFGLAFICIPSMTLLPQWFRRRRNVAIGIGAAGSGMGGVVFNLGMQKIMQERSVKYALITQCVICTFLNVVALAMTRTRVKEIRNAQIAANRTPTPYRIFDLQVLQSVGYWLFVMYVLCTMLGYVVLLYSLSAFTVSLGYSRYQGGIVSSMVSVGAFFGRPAMGLIADAFGPVTTSIVAHLIVTVFSLAMWIPCQNFATALVFGLIVGLFMGTIWSVMAPIATRVVGLHKLSVCLGMIWIYLSAGSLTAPIIGLELRVPSDKIADLPAGLNGYYKTAIFAGMMYFGSVIALWLLRGLLAARDQVAVAAETGFDDGELHLKVSTGEWARGLFKVRGLPRRI
ncbi:LAFA_0D02674g1_1 [Lachancea sp. 'fantastica']|nr:LAFA_0D02674g1_1 [Lachancea sp. 'fantastica']